MQQTLICMFVLFFSILGLLFITFFICGYLPKITKTNETFRKRHKKYEQEESERKQELENSRRIVPGYYY